MIRTATAVLLLAALAPAVPAAGAAEPGPRDALAVPGVNGPIVFVSHRDGNQEIYRMDADGSGQTRLTDHAAADQEPSYSPDGLYIVFTRFEGGVPQIYRMDADGSDPLRLATGAAAEWSPDSQHIIYGCSDGDSEICRMNVDGTGQTALTVNTVHDREASYSPDGQHIVFVAGALHTMDADGRNRVAIWSAAGAVASPSYSPDGQYVLFAHDPGSSNTSSDIKRIRTDGTDVTTIADDSFEEMEPSYSPDGRLIVYGARPERSAGCPDEWCSLTGDIVVMNADGTGGTVLTEPDDSGKDLLPSWSPSVPCRDLVPTVTGTDGNDVLTGGPGPDVILGHGGDDVIDGRGGADVICGGPGTDTASYAGHELDVVADLDGGLAGDDGSAEDGPVGSRDSIQPDVERLVGGFGDDHLTGSAAVNVLTGGPGDDTVTGGPGNDTLTGSSGDDVLAGGDGNDVLRGITGLDTLAGDGGNDTLDGGNDADALDGGAGVDTATYAARTGDVGVTIGGRDGGDGNAVDGPLGHRDSVTSTVERLVGGRGNDHLVGSPADNRLTGGLGADRLRGMGGVDLLIADDGVADLLIDCGDGTDPTPTIDSGIDPTPVGCP